MRMMTDAATTTSPTNPLSHLERIERRLELVLRDLRIFRGELEEKERDKGVLGSRGLTEFILGVLTCPVPTMVGVGSDVGYTIHQLLRAAEQAGYAVPTSRVLSKRLVERSRRVGDIRFDEAAKKWYGRRQG
jgi:hypothetical protein